ncbi:hypothetical protein V8C43DRAFT_268789 [Trichoderma afarasin]
MFSERKIPRETHWEHKESKAEERERERDEPRISVACTVIIFFSESRDDETAKSNFSTRGLTRAISFSVSVSTVSMRFAFAFFLHRLAFGSICYSVLLLLLILTSCISFLFFLCFFSL